MLDYRRMYTDAVCKRLEDYGFEEGMCPKKYAKYTQVNNVIKLRMKMQGVDIPKGGNCPITEDYYNAAIAMLDKVLPPI